MTPMRVVSTGLTDLGQKRTHNEDRYAIWAPDDPRVQARRGMLAVVADGMGGSQGGEIASRIAVESVIQLYRESRGSDPISELTAAIEEANRAVHAQAEQDERHRGMGTTCTAIAVRDCEAWIAHVGDTRAYLLRSGAIRQLTRDHSLVADLVRRGELSEQLARSDPRRNVLLRGVGVAESVEVDAFSLDVPLEPGDIIVLCSDGLHAQVTDVEIAAAFDGGDLQRSCSRLVGLANQRGGPDNITVVSLRMEGSEGVEPATVFGGATATKEDHPSKGVEAHGPGGADIARRDGPQHHGEAIGFESHGSRSDAVAGAGGRDPGRAPSDGPRGDTRRLLRLLILAALTLVAFFVVRWALLTANGLGRIGAHHGSDEDRIALGPRLQ